MPLVVTHTSADLLGVGWLGPRVGADDASYLYLLPSLIAGPFNIFCSVSFLFF